MSRDIPERVRSPLISGWCGVGSPEASHVRCLGGQRANPDKVFQPCPCPCHLPEERYDCDNCGGELAESTILSEVMGEEVWVHVSEKTGRMVGEYCP